MRPVLNFFTSVTAWPSIGAAYVCSEVFQAVEICAGEGMVTWALRSAGLRTAGLGIDSWYDFQLQHPASTSRVTSNPLDLLTDSGMAPLDAIGEVLHIL